MWSLCSEMRRVRPDVNWLEAGGGRSGGVGGGGFSSCAKCDTEERAVSVRVML